MHRREPAEPRIGQHAHQERHRVRGAPACGGRAQRREVGVGDRAERLDEPRVDLGLGQRARRGASSRAAEVEVVVAGSRS